MRGIPEANVLVSDLVAGRAVFGDAKTLEIFHKMLRETPVGQAWGVAVPTEYLDKAALPNGLQAQVMLPGITGITGIVRAPKHTLEHALKSCYCERADIMLCVICSRPLERQREHTDTCSESCFRRLELRQRAAWGI